MRASSPVPHRPFIILHRPIPPLPVASATHGVVAACGLSMFLLAAFVVRLFDPFSGNITASALFILCATVTAVFAVDSLRHQIHRRTSTGLDHTRDVPSWQRTFTKFCGLLGTFACLALLYWLFPEYRQPFYDRYFELLQIILPVWLALALHYIHWVDRRMREPRDGYWQMGQLVLLRWERIDTRILGQHLLGWLIKGFFLPLMFGYMCRDLDAFMHTGLADQRTFLHYFAVIYAFLYFIDVALVSMGYVFSLRVFDTHIRSAEPTLLGWVAALACYEPFWSMLVSRQYLAYDPGHAWDAWLHEVPIAQFAWGTGILLLTGIYVWATVMFGARFSNLTHRGIITNGPYRWSKHPAYLAKNLSWWMIAVPFVVHGSPADTIRYCLLLVALNAVYVLRAKTEEWHLSRDPDYVRYALWIEEHGLLRGLRRSRLTRWLTYRAPAPASGR